MTYPSNFESKIGFDIVRQMIKDYCLFELGKAKVDQVKFSVRENEIRENLTLTSEFRQICQFEDHFPVSYYIDITPVIRKARVEGTYITEEELFNFRRSLEAIKQVLRFFNQADEQKYPCLKRKAGSVTYYKYVEERMDAILSVHGKIKDNASPELLKIRREIQQQTVAVSRKLQQLLKKAMDDGYVEKDSTLSVRNGRQVIPVPVTHKRRLGGIVHDESATGRTAYIEPTEVVEMNNAIRELEYAEIREVIKILTRFTDDIRPYLDDLLISYDFLATVDFIRAKALFALSIQAVQPVLFAETGLNWQRAVHPLLYLHHKSENKTIVPLDIQLNQHDRILLISGPNAGGKSVCLKTVGLLQYMLQCGLLVPMSENSETGLFADIFLDIGDEQSIENDLSTYSSHLLNMKYCLKNAGPSTLVLIDEFGTGTEPHIGGAIAEAMLDALNKKAVFGVITTHYSNLKHFAASSKGIVNGAMLFDTGLIQPLFRLEIGKPGSSFAIDIARKIGLPEDLLTHAAEKAGEEHIKFDRHLREIIRDKHYWESKRDKIRLAEKELSGVVKKYTGELEQMQAMKKEMLKQAREEAEQLLSKANREIENTIRTIKESLADKEKTREARESFSRLREELADEAQTEDPKLKAKLKQIRQQEEKYLKEQFRESGPAPGKKESESDRQIVPGDTVRLYGQDLTGEVLSIHGEMLMVAFGGMITTLKANKLERINPDQRSQKRGTVSNSYVSSMIERKARFKTEIDLRGKRGYEAVDMVRSFIDEAVMVGATELRILHGKGNGVLKQLIREYLHTVDVVRSYDDEHIERGGAGITVVLLDY